MHLSGLHWYPIKSCRGISAEHVTLDARGIVGDREYLVVDADGGFLTQREHPRLALVAPEPGEPGFAVSAPGHGRCDWAPRTTGHRIAVTIWNDRCTGVDQGDAPAEWFSDLLGAKCRLVRFAVDHPRRVDPTYAPSSSDQVAFSDGYPLLAVTEEAVAELNRRLPAALPMNRFRPNLVVRGAEAGADDRWSRIRIGAMGASVVKPCIRCRITTTDQRTGEVGVEPLRTLRTYRYVPGTGVWFGQNVCHDGPGTLRVGDPVVVEAERDVPLPFTIVAPTGAG